MLNPYKKKTNNTHKKSTRPASVAIASQKRGPQPSSTPVSEEQEQSLLLKHLLPKLRPFQREAYEFATQGIVSPRLRASNAANDNNNNNKKSHTKNNNPPEFEYDPKLLGKGRVLLADEMGLGKTVTSLAIMAHYYQREEWPLLILCPASLKHTWAEEIERFIPTIPPKSVYVVRGFNDVGFLKQKDLNVVICTYSVLQRRSAVGQLLLNSCNPNSDDTAGIQFQCVIADESHNLKQKKCQRSKIALPILQNAKRLCLLSGTPALARPVELWLQLHVLAPLLFGSYTSYVKTYCNAHFKFGRYDVSGLSNAPELHTKLKQIMIRRLKTDVLHELPPKQRSIIPITINSNNASFKQNQELLKQLQKTRISVSELVGDDQQTANFEARRLFLQAYQASGIIKAQAVADYLVDWIAGAGTQKILVFCHHKAVLDTMELAVSKELEGVGHIRIDGSVNSNDRAQLVRKFQSIPRVRVALLSMTAAGVGLTLTAASTVIFSELHFTPGVLAQAEDRAHRIGQRNAVNILYCVCKDKSFSVDSLIWEMLGRKVSTLEQVIDGRTGKERTALAAKEIEGNNHVKPRQSTQDELTNFFSETAVTNDKQSLIPVKGSIMYFFKKKASESTPSSRPKKQGHDQSVTIAKKDALLSLPTPSGPVAPTPPALEKDVVEWACQTCTYLNNSKRMQFMSCKMCNTRFTREQPSSTAMHITPLSAARRSRKDLSTSASNPANKPHSSTSKKESPEEVVIIDDDESPRADKKTPPDVVVIDDSENIPAKKCNQTCNSSELQEEILTFSVSENTGGITLHSAQNNNRSFMVNVGIHDVLTEETVNALTDAQTSRARAKLPAQVSLVFDKEAVLQVVKKLDSNVIHSRRARKRCCKQIEEFVTYYHSLREIEKKTIKDSGKPFSSKGLAQSAARVMVAVDLDTKINPTAAVSTSSTSSNTERYVGGAKERAQERLGQGAATREDMAVLKGDSCAWCAGSLSTYSRTAKAVYCSQECAEQGRLRRGGFFGSSRIRDQAFALEGGVCQICGVDAQALYLRVKALAPPQRLSVLCNAQWKLPKTHQSLERLLQNPAPHNFWEVDHIVAVAEGGGDSGMDNLRTLCVPCHKVETQRLHGRLKLSEESSPATKNKRKQMDIRTIFRAITSTTGSGVKRRKT